jgi:hypothetical protein
MQPVLVDVGHVVEDVDGPGERAEDQERAQRRPDERAEQVLREDEAGEDEEVLHPLPRAEGEKHGGQEAHGAST